MKFANEISRYVKLTGTEHVLGVVQTEDGASRESVVQREARLYVRDKGVHRTNVRALYTGEYNTKHAKSQAAN